VVAELHHWCPVPTDQISAGLRRHGFTADEKIMFDEPYLFARSEEQ
jgi:hypothetical protein